MALQLTYPNGTLPVKLDSISYGRRVDDRGTCNFEVDDLVGYSMSQGQWITVTDTATSTKLYSGYIEKIDNESFKFSLGQGNRLTIGCKDQRWLAEKRVWSNEDFEGWAAGDIACETHRAILASEGVQAAYAMRHDQDTTGFSQGTLTGTTASNNTLLLAPSGTDKTKTFQTASDFTTNCTLVQTSTISPAPGMDKINLAGRSAIKYEATAGANLDNNNLSCYWKIWSGSYTLQANDHIKCSVWIDSRSPEIKASIDMQFSDGTWMHDTAYSTNIQDQYVIELNPKSDLKGWADDQWMERTALVTSTGIGKTVVAVYVVFLGVTGGKYTAYFTNLRILNSLETITRVTFFDPYAIQMQSSVKASSTGYGKISCKFLNFNKTPCYYQWGTWLSNAVAVGTVGILRNSMLSWIEEIAIQKDATTGNNDDQILVEATTDGGATWQKCENHKPIPGLVAGQNLTGMTVQLRATLKVGGPDPTLTPTLRYISWTINNAPNATKSDFKDIDLDSTTFATGVLTNTTAYTDGLKVTGKYRDWDDLSVASQTLFGVTGSTLAGPLQGEAENYFFLRTDDHYDCRSRFDFAGTWQNFIAELDIHLVTTGPTEYGFVYRTTGWINANDTYAYGVHIHDTAVELRRCTNGGASVNTLITSIPITLTVGQWYRLKVVANGSTHQAYLNDVLIYSVTDATYSAAGSVGVRLYNATGVRASGHYDNFGIIGYESDLIAVGTRVTPALALSGTLLGSRIDWTADEPSSASLLVEATIDNGVTWKACTNGDVIPDLIAGYNAAGKSLKIRATFTNQNVNMPVVLTGLAIRVFGAYSASGTRVSPALALDPVGAVLGDTAIMWKANTPTNTGCTVGTGNNGSSWSSSTNGGVVNGFTPTGNMFSDDFVTNTLANFVGAFWSGGVTPTGSVDTANSKLDVTAGTNAYYTWTPFGAATKDVVLELITDQVDAGGVVFRVTDANNLYFMTLRDNSSGSNSNTLTLKKRVAGVETQLVSPTDMGKIFTRGTFHTLKVTMIGSVITAYFDGFQVFSYTDASPLAGPGSVGIRQNSSTTSHWYSFRAKSLGETGVGKNAYSKVTLTSTDPTVEPILEKLVLSARSPNIMTGATLDKTNYQYQQKVSGILDDGAGQSKYFWDIDKDKNLKLLDRQYNLAPFPLDQNDPDFLGVAAVPKLTKATPLYRNKQYIRGAIELVVIPESKIGNGVSQTWPLSYPVDSVVAILINNDPQTFGVQGVDTNKNFYYTPGETTFAQDTAGAAPTELQEISIIYIGKKPYVAMAQDTSQQTALAAQDGTTGIVEAAEDCQGLTSDAADTLAQARIDQYALLTRDWTFSYQKPGLDAGQFISIFVPAYGLNDVDMLITSVTANVTQKNDGNLLYRFAITATEGPPLGSYLRLVQKKLFASS